MKKLHVFLGRMHPVHLGHKAIFEEMVDSMKNQDSMLVLIGSADKRHTERNPLPVKLRLEMIREVVDGLDGFYGTRRIIALNDLTHEEDNSKEWGDYLMESIDEYAGIDQYDKVVLHYSDEPSIIGQWFDREKHPKLEFMIHNRWSMQETSATKIREMIVEGNWDVMGMVPKEVHKFLPEIAAELEKVK